MRLRRVMAAAATTVLLALPSVGLGSSLAVTPLASSGVDRDPGLSGAAHPGTGILPNFAERRSGLILLQAGAFDPLTMAAPHGGLPLADESALDQDAAVYWLVQVRHARYRDVRDAIAAAGGTIAGTIPDDTYVVRATPDQRAAIAAHPAVRWSGYFQPGWKVPVAAAGRPGLLDLEGYQTYLVRVFRTDPDKASARQAIAALPGAAIINDDDDQIVVEASAAEVPALAAIPAVEWVSARPTPLLLNKDARWVVDTGERDLYAATAPGRLTGAGQTAGVADTGVNYTYDRNGLAHKAFRDCAPDGTSCKLADYTQVVPGTGEEQLLAVAANGTSHRKMAAYFDLGQTGPNPSDDASHGTHVAGSVTADRGNNGTWEESDGMAPGARLVHQNIGSPSGGLALPDDAYQLWRQSYRPHDPASVPEAYVASDYASYRPLEDARTHNNSYGLIAPVIDDGQASALDLFVWHHEDMVIVVSAGNSGPDPGSIGTPSVAKNNLSSAASSNGRQPMVAIDSITNFSSHGPTGDGRIGPDLATPGEIVISPKGGTEDDDHYLQGTSMSGPVLAGIATLVRQYFWDGYGPSSGEGFPGGAPDLARRHNPSSALVKATLVNGADRMRGFYTGDDGGNPALDGQYPSGGQGFGLVNLDNSLYFAGDPENAWYRDVWRADADAFPVSNAAASRSYSIHVDAGQPLDVSLAWTDAPNLAPAGTPALVNNLNLVVTGPGGLTYIGNNFNTRSSPSTTTYFTPAGQFPPDTVNNSERVRVAAPAAGDYTITVSTPGVLDGPAGFALAARGNIAAVGGTFNAGPPRQTDLPGSPAISDVRVEPVSADLAKVTFATSEPTTATATIEVGGSPQTYADVYQRSQYPNLPGGRDEPSPTYNGLPVVSTRHEILLTGITGANPQSIQLRAYDLAGNVETVASPYSPVSFSFQPRAGDIGQLTLSESGDRWGVGKQLYGGYIHEAPPDEFLGAFMYRLPQSVDPATIVGAAIEFHTAHDLSNHYNADPVFTVDLLPESVEGAWGTQTYLEIRNATPATQVSPETTVRRGAGQRLHFTFSCQQLTALRETLSNQSGERRAAFRYVSTDPGETSLVSMEFGYNRRSRGADLRPKLVLVTTTGGASPPFTPCDPGAPAPTISDLGVHEGLMSTTVTVSWRTDVDSDSLVLFREQGSSGDFTQVGSPLLTRTHQLQVRGLDPTRRYEFGVRSAACNGASTTDDNGGAGYHFYPPPPPPPPPTDDFFFHGTPQDQANKQIGLVTRDPSTSATFDRTPPASPQPDVQQVNGANSDFVANPLGAYWFDDTVTGTIARDVEVRLYLSTPNPIHAGLTVSFFADPVEVGGSATLIGRSSFDPVLTPAPALFRVIVPVSGTIASKLLVQVTGDFTVNDSGADISYDAVSTPSGFAIPLGDPPPPPPPGVPNPQTGPVPPPPAGSSGLSLGTIPARSVPTAADLAAGTGTCAAISINDVPSADLTATPQSGTAPLIVTFDGSASSDPDGQADLTSWSLSFGDGSASAYGAGTPSAEITHTYGPGTFLAVLTVTDSMGASDADSETIAVTASANLPPVATLDADPATGTAPLDVTFDASGSSDPDGASDLAAWSLSFGDGSSTTGAGAPPSGIGHTYGAGSFEARLSVTDTAGASDDATATISANARPLALLTATPSTVTEGVAVSFDGSASADPDGSIATWSLSFGDGVSASGAGSPPADTPHTYSYPGTFSALLTVTDSVGASAEDAETVRVVAAVNEPPSAVLTATPTSGNAPLFVTFDGSGTSDPNGASDLASWSLSFGDGATTGGLGAPPSNRLHAYPAGGSFVARLALTDTSGASGDATATIRVNGAPTARLARTPGSGTAPLEVTFDGSQTTDPNGAADLASWSLAFGDGALAAGSGGPPAATTHTFTVPGTYLARLVVTDTAGQADDSVVSTEVTSPSPAPSPVTTPSAESVFYFAEGTTLPGFREYLLIANPEAVPATASVTYFFDDGSPPLETAVTVPGQGRLTIDVVTVAGEGRTGVSTQVRSGAPIVAERSVFFDRAFPIGTVNGAHSVLGATEPRTSWAFAEGSTLDGMQEYLTIQNPSASEARLTIGFGAGLPATDLVVAGRQRRTVDVNSEIGPAVTGHMTLVTSTTPVLVERPMYFLRAVGDDSTVINGGHVAFGIRSGGLFTFAEGTVLAGFSEYLTLGNPGNAPADATILYLFADGTTATRVTTVATGGRATVRVFDPADPLGVGRDVSDAVGRGVSVQVKSGAGIVAERPLYFHRSFGSPGEINGGHVAVGSSLPSRKWSFAEGSTLPGFYPFLTLANTGSDLAETTITYALDDGRTIERVVTVGPSSRLTVQVYGPPEQGGVGEEATGFGVFLASSKPVVAERPLYVDRVLPGLPRIRGGTTVVGLAGD